MAKIRYHFNTHTLRYDRVKTNYNWQKIIFKIIIFLAIAYFILGYILVLLRLFDINKFLTLSGIVGGVASVIGLLTFITNRLNKDDVEKIGVEYFKEVVNAADKLRDREEKLKNKEKQLNLKEREIKELEVKKAELEFAVRKASMTIFLKDQLVRVEDRIVEIIQDHKELSNNIQQRKGIIEQLKELREEIEINGNTKLVEEVISMVSKERDNSSTEIPLTFLEKIIKYTLSIIKI